MSKTKKLALTIVFGVSGIVGKVIVFGGPVWDVPLLAELSAWAGGVAVAVAAFLEAKASRDEAKAGRESAERGEAESRAARDEAKAGRESAERGEAANRP